MFSTGVFCVATKNHIKGGSGSFETPPLWENRRQKTARQINYKLSHVERDPGYVLLFIQAARAAVALRLQRERLLQIVLPLD